MVRIIKINYLKILVPFICVLLLNACTEQEETVSVITVPVSVPDCDTDNFFSENESRNFKMGFTTWSYGPKEEDVATTYKFVETNADIYAEQIDNKIPWKAWINNTELPAAFTNEMQRKVTKRINDKQLLLSVSLLNLERNELAKDFDNTIPSYTGLDDSKIEDAYFKHIQYLVNLFNPEYLVIAIEVNELRLRTKNKWEGYKSLIKKVTSRIKEIYPTLKISESISLHNLYKPEGLNPEEYINEIVTHMNTMDFVSISFYPFLKNLHSKTEIQEALDFLYSKTEKPIAFVETGHIAEDLSVENYDLFLKGDECGQNKYLELLLTNAQKKDYKFIIWWTHRDYDALWKTFPDDVMDLGKLWKDTGLLNESGKERMSFKTWTTVFNKNN